MTTEILTPDQLTDISNAYRSERNLLLRESDWTHVTDTKLTAEEQTAWANYRQALRDITTQPGFPTDIIWPERP